MKQPQEGDYFFLPYAGSRRSRLVKAVAPLNDLFPWSHWLACNEAGLTTTVLLTGCRRCTPSLVRRLLATPNAEMCGACSASEPMMG